MIILFYFISFLVIVFSVYIFKQLINPCSLYALIWLLGITLYIFKGFPYEDLSAKTIIVIILFELFLTIGIMIGERNKIRIGNERRTSIPIRTINYNSIAAKKIIDKYIVISTLIAAISIVSGLYGVLASNANILSLIKNVSQTYHDRVNGNINYGIGIFASMIYVTIILISFQISNGRFKLFYIIPILLAFVNSINLGGRNASVYTIICLLAPIFISKNKKFKMNNEKKRIRKSIKIITILSAAAIVVFLTINSQRAQNSRVLYYNGNMISSWLSVYVQKSKGFLTGYSYFTGPFAYLNYFLDNPYYSFGVNTFYFIFRQLAKFGFDVPIMTSLPFYNVPQSMNVGTYITELLIDFGLVGGIIVSFIFGITFGVFHRRTKDDDLTAYLFTTLMYICILLSFFMWYIRTPAIWLACFYGFILISRIKKKLVNEGCFFDLNNEIDPVNFHSNNTSAV